jgi:hypothetical protein
MQGPHANQWTEAIGAEIASMTNLGVYELVERPADVNVITCRWILKVKLDSNNLPVKYKARIVAREFQQLHGIDYNDTFAPVVKYKSIRMLLTLAAFYRMSIDQLDYTTAFLNADLPESIYMEQPEGCDTGDGRVWKLKKAIYGLKQAPREWNIEVDTYLRTLNYQPTAADPCIYIKHVSGCSTPIILALYVDDTLCAHTEQTRSVWVADKEAIGTKYKITDQGKCTWVLNMDVATSEGGKCISLCQNAYIDTM